MVWRVDQQLGYITGVGKVNGLSESVSYINCQTLLSPGQILARKLNHRNDTEL